MIVLLSMSDATCETSTWRVQSSTRAYRTLILKRRHAFSKAEWTEMGTTMLGFVTPRSVAARSRYALIARLMLSVPPDVTTPHASSPPLNMSTVMATISDSILRTPGKTPGCSGFVHANMPYTSVSKSVYSSSSSSPT